MVTEWTHRMMLFVREADKTQNNIDEFANILSTYGSGESADNERIGWSNVVRLSVTGTEPAQAFGVEVPVKLAMRAPMESFIGSLTGALFFVVRNWDNGGGLFTNLLVRDNGNDIPQIGTLVGVPPWDGAPFTIWDAIDHIHTQIGWQVIQ